MKSGTPATNRIALSDSQSTNLWMYVTNNQWVGSLKEGGINQNKKYKETL